MIGAALQRPFSTLVGVVALVVLGAMSLARLPISLLPDSARPRLVITARAEGHTLDEMLHGATIPLERRLDGLDGLTSISSETEDGVARLVADAAWFADADRLQIEASRSVEGASRVPLESLQVTVSGGDASPTIEVAAFGGSPTTRSTYVRKVLVPELARLAGAGRMEILGTVELRAVVEPRPAALAALGLTASDVVARLEDVGKPIPAGHARVGGAVRPIVVSQPVRSLRGLEAVQLESAGRSVPLSEVARVSLREIPDGTSFLQDGREGVLVRVFRAPGANAVELARQARGVVEGLASRHPPGIEVSVTKDRSREVVAALLDVVSAGLLGILLGALVLRAMLVGWASTLALVVVIPASMVASFSAFALFGVPLDVVSLAGLALAAGMLVDSAIVVLESIDAARARGSADPALEGTRQVGNAVVATTLTTVVVFAPIAYMRGLAQAFFGEQAFAVVASLLASLLFSLTLTPILVRRGRATGEGWSPGRGLYVAALDAVLARPVLVTCGFVLLSTLALLSAPGLRRELMPRAASRALVVEYEAPRDLTPERQRAIGAEVDAAVREAAAGIPGARVLAMSGLAEEGQEAPGTLGRVELELPRATGVPAAATLLPAVAERVARLPDVVASVGEAPSAFTEAVTPKGRVRVVCVAAGEERAQALATRVAAHLEADHIGTTREWARRPRRAMELVWDEARLARLGLSRDELEAQAKASMSSRQVGVVRIGDAEPEIRVEPLASGRESMVPLAIPSSVPAERARGLRSAVPLGALGRMVPVERPGRALRVDGRPAQLLELPAGSPLDLDPARLARIAASVVGGPDERVLLTGEALEMATSFRELGVALLLALVLVFLTMAALFESFAIPALVMTTVPVAVGGSLACLAATGQTLNLMSLVGIIVMTGIVVDNAIVLLDRVDGLRRAGVDRREAMRRAGEERYRPILMTTLTTLLGMLPLAAWGGEGIELRRALAVAVLGAMVTSLPASLLLIPCLDALLPVRAASRPGTTDAP